MNDSVASGETTPYAYFGFEESDYLTFAQWLQDLLRLVREQSTLLDYYEEPVTPAVPIEEE